MRHQKGERRWRDPVDSARLANGSGPNRIQLLQNFHRQSIDRCVIEAILQLEALIAAVRRHVRGLALQVDRVLGIDLKLLADPGI